MNHEKYTINKNRYMELNQSEQTGGGNFQDNIFLNKEYFGMHHTLKYRSKRLQDFQQIIRKLKDKLIPKNKTEIDQKLLEKYIKLHKKENRPLIEVITKNLQYVSFKEFHKQLCIQINRFNKYIKENKIKKYVFVLGVGSDDGFSSHDYNLFKSNMWVFLLAYKHLKIKPYDIILNLNIAIRLHYPDIRDFLFADDCSYSGSQLVDSVLKNAASELLYDHADAYVINDNKQVVYAPILDKKFNVHLLIPYMSSKALTKINNFETTSGIGIIKYVSQIIKTYGDILDTERLKSINDLYTKFYGFIDFAGLTPVYFQHKIADMLSTIDLILIKGQVLDDPTKRLVFIKECMYDKNNPDKKEFDPTQKNFIHMKLYCPAPPYLEFKKYLST
jgi:hypothetical protein